MLHFDLMWNIFFTALFIQFLFNIFFSFNKTFNAKCFPLKNYTFLPAFGHGYFGTTSQTRINMVDSDPGEN